MHAKEDRLDVHKDTQTAWYSNKTDLLSTISFLRNICEVLQERAACVHFIGVLNIQGLWHPGRGVLLYQNSRPSSLSVMPQGEQVSVDAALLLPPYYFAGMAEEGLERWLRQVMT